MKVVVIGGAGFIGRHVVQKLINYGKTVTVIDVVNSNSVFLPSQVNYMCLNLNDEVQINEIKTADEIVDLAYASVPKTSFDDPISDITSNLPLLLKLIQIIEPSLKKFIYISSGGTIYGEAKYLPIDEEHPTNPISPYGITKLTSEKYLMMYHRMNNLPFVCLRPANAYGEGQQPYKGQGFIATAVASIMQDKSITLYGREGTVRDYIHVEDISSSIIAALDKGMSGEIYNVGSGIGYSNLEVLEIISKIFSTKKSEPKIEFLPERKFDVKKNILNSDKLSKLTGWKASVNLKKGLEKYINHLFNI